MGYLSFLSSVGLSSSRKFEKETSDGKIARHEIPDWCQHPQRGSPADIAILYPHCSPNGEATTLDVACYPPPGGPVNGGPDILPPKRQTVVDRLRRRLEHYRRHQGSCQPRYDQSANGQYDIQRQETLHLKQRFLEAKAKKTRRNDHGRNSANGNETSQRNSNANQSKLKRQASSPLLDCAIDNLTEGHANKIPRPEQPCDSFQNSSQQQQAQQQNQQSQQSGIPNFSVQIVQQFSNTNTSQASHSQTIQTNVTVQGMNGGLIKSSNSPLAPTAVSSASPGCVTSGGTVDGGNQLSNSVPNGAGASTAVSVSTSVECKREPDTDFPQCSVNGSLPLSELNSELTSANNDVNTTTTSSTAATTGDRFSDSLANLGFPEDSNDDVIHPDLLKDIIDDVFTNPSDLINGFNFVDNLGLKDNTHTLDDDKDSLRPMMSLNKSMQDSPPNHFQNPTNSPNLFSMSQSQQTVFDFPTGNVNSNAASQNMPNSSNVQPSFTSSRVGSYTATSPSMPGIPNNGLGLDFKLTEPSPAAQTLKQMAEQHQNMQQKQQQLGLGVSPRSPFGSDSFPDPLSNIRTNFLNGSPNSMPTLQKSPPGMFQSMGFQQQQSFTASSNSAVKQEVVTPNTPMYPSNMNQHLSDLELHKRRQQALQMQQNQMGSINRPPFSHSPDQKRQFPVMRQLPMYNDPSPGHPPNDGSASNSPVPHHPSQFMRSVSTPEVTPSSQGFASSPSPSAAAMHPNQSHQIQHNANNQQQLQMAQSQMIMSQDLKPVISAQQLQQQQLQLQQQQHMQSRGFYPGQTSVHMSQSQSIGFQFPGSARSGSPTTNQRSSAIAQTNPNQRQQLYMTRPPPDYQATVEPNSAGISSLQSGVLSQGAQMHMNVTDSIGACNDQSNRNLELRNLNVSKSYSGMMPTSQASACQSYSGIIPSSNSYPGVVPISNANTLSKPYSGMLASSESVSGSKSYSGIITLDDTIPSPNNKPFPDGMPISVSRPFAGLTQSSNSISVSKSLQDTISMSNASAMLAGKSYPSNVSSINPLSISSPNNIVTSKAYQRRMVNSNLPPSQPYAVSSGILQGQSQMMPVTTMAPTFAASKGRVVGKQVAARRGRHCGPLYRQQKPPNVNVGPEGLNISQRPPVMTTDWRHAYVQQNQQIPNVNAQLRMTYHRQTAQNFGQNAGNGNNYQPLHINPNSPNSGNNSLLSVSSNTEVTLSRQSGIQEIGSVTNHMSLQPPPQVVMGSDNSMLCSSQLHMSTSIASPGESMNHSHQQVFSPSTSSNGSSQNIVHDSSQFNLDFLDNLDCSTSDLLNFDVMQGESTSFPLLEDIGMLDK